jgi:hypothetical protein
MGTGDLLSGWIACEFETKGFCCEFCIRDYLAYYAELFWP